MSDGPLVFTFFFMVGGTFALWHFLHYGFPPYPNLKEG
jgi:hypothetical protein